MVLPKLHNHAIRPNINVNTVWLGGAVIRALDLRLEVAGSMPAAALSSAILDKLLTHIVQRLWCYNLDLLDLLPWRCLIDTHQQLFHGLPPETFVVRHVSSGLQVNVHHMAVVFYHIDPSFLWSPSTPVAVDTAVHDYAGKSVLTHPDYMAEILQASLLNPVFNIIVPVQSCLNL